MKSVFWYRPHSTMNAISTEFLTPSSFHIHVFTSVKVRNERRPKAKTGSNVGDNSNTRWFRGKGKSKHTGSGKSGSSACHANFNSVEDSDYDDDMNEPADVYSSTIQLTLEVTMRKELWTITMMRRMTRFVRMLLWMMSLLSRNLNWMQVLFLPTRGKRSLILQGVHFLRQGEEKRKGQRQEQWQISLFARHISHWKIVDGDCEY